MKQSVKAKQYPGFVVTALSLVLPLVVWLLFAVGRGEIPVEDAAAGKVVLIYYTALVLCVVMWFVRTIFRRKHGPALILLALLLVLVEGALWYGLRFNGSTEIGENEDFPGYSTVSAGPLAKPAVIPLTLIKAKDNERKSILLVDGRETGVALNQKFSWHDLTLIVTEQAAAPLFILDDAKGEDKDSNAGYMKLLFAKEKDLYFQWETIPHRFYISLPERVLAPAGVSPADNLDVPEMLHLRIMRGKLTIFNNDIKMGETVAFEGHKIRYENGAPWVKIQVDKARIPYLLYVGAALLVIGVILSTRRARV